MRYKQTMQLHGKSAVLFVLCLVVAPAMLAQDGQHKATGTRPLTRHEGSAIVRAALHSHHLASSPSDCSHLVHAVFESAGFFYEYAPSSDLYEGINQFRRVSRPQPGDLAVWPGHAGIVVNPGRHSFFSVLSSGPGVDFYDSPYWKQRGRPRFFRYVKRVPGGVLSSSLHTASASR